MYTNFFATITCLLMLNAQLSAQDYRTEFSEYLNDGDTLAQLEVLNKWEKKDPDNPELFTCYFNYYFYKSEKEILSIQPKEPEGEALIIQDSSGTDVGFIGSHTYYDAAILQRGLDKINQGIELYPNRLDMRFGKIYVLGKIEDWEAFTNEIVKTVQYSGKNNNAWTWTLNEKREDGKDFFISSLQDYQLQLYNTEDDDLLVNMRTIANEILILYPDNIESWSNLAITYLITGDYDKGIDALHKAEKINPTDAIVLSNIAHGYKLKGNKEKAIEYYEKTIQHGSETSGEFARKQIEELKNGK